MATDLIVGLGSKKELILLVELMMNGGVMMIIVRMCHPNPTQT